MYYNIFAEDADSAQPRMYIALVIFYSTYKNVTYCITLK